MRFRGRHNYQHLDITLTLVPFGRGLYTRFHYLAKIQFRWTYPSPSPITSVQSKCLLALFLNVNEAVERVHMKSPHQSANSEECYSMEAESILRSTLSDFVLLVQIGIGSYGVVWKAKRIIDGQFYAIKEVNVSALPRQVGNALHTGKTTQRADPWYHCRYWCWLAIIRDGTSSVFHSNLLVKPTKINILRRLWWSRSWTLGTRNAAPTVPIDIRNTGAQARWVESLTPVCAYESL